ncbi:MAG: MBG domain-containing protein [Christensenellales bacterium]
MKNKIAVLAVIILFLAVLFVCDVELAGETARADSTYQYSSESVFEIDTEEEFYAFYDFALSGGYSFTGKTVRLSADVDASRIDSSKGRLSPFGGTFEGNGHIVSNLKSSLFGDVSSSGKILDLELRNVSLNGYALAQNNHGLIKNVVVSGTVYPGGYYRASGIVDLNGANGRIENCINYCVHRSDFSKAYFSGIAYKNVGVISNSVFNGEFVANFKGDYNNNFAGISYENTGSITGCSVWAEYRYEGSGYVEANQKVFLIADGTGSVSDCSALAYYGLCSGIPFSVIGETASSISNVKVVVTDGTTATAYRDVDGAVSECASSELDFSTDVKRYAAGEGTDSDPYVIKGFGGLTLMRGAAIFGGVFALGSVVNLDGTETISTLNGFNYPGSVIVGKGYALTSGQNATVFGAGYNIVGQNVGFVDCEYSSLSGGASDGYTDYGEDFGTGTASEVVPSELTGEGTKESPYLICDAESLKALDGREGYALVTADIVINDVVGERKKLNIAEIKAELNGNGKTISGIFDEPLWQTLSGSVKNAVLRGSGDSPLCAENSGRAEITTVYSRNGQSGLADVNRGELLGCVSRGSVRYGICRENAEGGTIEGSRNYAAADYAFAGINSGTVTACENFGTATHIFGCDGTGSVTNSLNYSSCVDDEAPYADKCIDSGTDKGYYSQGIRYASDLGYLELKEVGFDFNVFGYEKGSVLPSLRKSSLSYKSEIKVLTYGFNLDSDSYSDDISYTQEEINEAVTNINGNVYDDTVYEWSYNGEPLYGDIKNAGSYSVVANFSGNFNYLPSRESYSFVINKADSDISPLFGEGDFVDCETVYDGESVALVAPEPLNAAELTARGFSSRFVLKKNGSEIAAAISAGEYEYVALFTANNYNDLSVSVKIVVKKAELLLNVNDLRINYGEDFDGAACSVKIEGLVAADEGKTLQTLTPNWKNGFSTDYFSGAPAGEYTLTFSGTADDYYYTVTNGKLSVDRIPVPADGIDFYGATVSDNGTYEVDYCGRDIELQAVFPSGITAEYSNNSNKNFGEYTVTATFYKDENYIPLVLRTTLKIKKVVLIATAPSLTITYGIVPEISSEQVVFDGFVGGETFDTVFTAPFVAEVFDGETAVVGLLDAGQYKIKASSSETADNYTTVFVDGVLTVDKASLKTIRNNDGSVPTDFCDGEKTYDGMAIVKEMDLFTAEEGDVEYEIVKDGSVATEIKNAGAYIVTATVTPKGALVKNYLVTEYTLNFTVKKKGYTLRFDRDEYSFTYDGTDKNSIVNYPYTGLPEGADVSFTHKKNGIVTDILHAGSYEISIAFAGTENELPCECSAVVTVCSRTVTVAIKTEYDYAGKDIPVNIEVLSIEGDVNDELDYSDVVFAYAYPSGASLPYIVNAGDYIVDVAIKNADYNATGNFEVKVNKISVPFTLGKLSFDYGTSGDVSVGGKSYTVTENTVTVKDYVYDEISFDVKVRYGKNAGTYVLTDKDVFATTNYDFVPQGENTIVVSAKKLNVIWTVDGTETNKVSYEAAYLGKSQNYRFGFKVTDLCYGESASELNIVKTVSGTSDNIYDAGTYYVGARLFDSVNYELSNASFTVTVGKAELYFTVNDTEIYQWERYGLSYSCTGRVGEDADKSVTALKGAQIRTVTTYDENSPVGSVCPVTVEASFDNYSATVIKTGTVTVVENPYPDYLSPSYWHDVSYVYTGGNITVQIVGVASEVRVIYSDNVQKNAGEYTVGATVIYPTGRQKTGTCRLTILKASPAPSVDNAERLYVENHILSANDIIGGATYNGEIVEGEFIPDGEQLLQLGSAVYKYVFMPLDDRNFNSVKGEFGINAVKISLADFNFDKIEDIAFNETGIVIYDAVKMSLNPVIGGLKLYRNGSRVDYVVFDKTERVNVKVTLGDSVAYERDFDVTLEKNTEPFVIDEKALVGVGATFSDKTIYVDKNGGRISLGEKYADEFVLYVNGLRYDEFVINGNEGEILVTVRTAGIGNIVYSGIFTVALVPENVEIKKDYSLYYIIGGSALGVCAIIAVVLVIWKKKHG